MQWYDLFKIWTYNFELDPKSKRYSQVDITGAGSLVPEVIPDIRQGGEFGGASKGFIRVQNDFVDLSSITARTARYKEYERLRNIPEIDQAVSVMADEACVIGKTKIATPYYGMKPIEWFVNNMPDERFLVYCWDFEKEDYALGWAFNPRYTKTAKTIKVKLDDGTSFICTPDHLMLMEDGNWTMAGDLEYGSKLKPFYRLDAKMSLSTGQYPRVFTHKHGWKNERNFIDEWRTGEITPRQEKLYRVCRTLAKTSIRNSAKLCGWDWNTMRDWMKKDGFTLQEIRELENKKMYRRVLNVSPWKTMDVYDLSVEKHMNFCGESVIFHNCQRNDDNNVAVIEGVDEDIKEELDWFIFDRKMVNLNRRIWNLCKRLFQMGDFFLEAVLNPENPKDGILKIQELPPDSMYRIETTKGKVLEFQQAKEGPDFQSLTRAPITQSTESDLQQSTALRFHPKQIIHFRIGDDRKEFYPYGVSLIEPARGPAHQLRLMEDSMVVYRLSRAPERRVFYIDTSHLAPARVESFMDRIKDQFRKKKVPGKGSGVNSVEERWHPPAIDEDIWLPIRANSNTKIETLEGAKNLGEIDDALYFRNKLFTALNFPKNYFANEDPGVTKITLSAQDARFSRMIERLQSHVEDGLLELAERHLELLGVPEEAYENLKIKLTPPSDWQEMSKMEIMNARIQAVNSLKGSMIMSDYDLLKIFMKYPDNIVQEMIARMKIQKLEDFKFQVFAANPQLLGIGVPSPGTGTEIGAEPGGPNPMLGPGGEGGGMGGPPGMPGGGGPMPEPPAAKDEAPEGLPKKKSNGIALPKASREDVKKYDLEIQNYASEEDYEELDMSER